MLSQKMLQTQWASSPQSKCNIHVFEAAMSLSDAWLGEGDAAAGEAQEEVKQTHTDADTQFSSIFMQ